MKVLVVANYNEGRFSPFVMEQMESLTKQGIEIDTYGIVGKGLLGYLRNLAGLKKKIQSYQPDLIHAHYGLSGLLANLQRKVPVVTTFHGSDIHSGGITLKLSQIAMRLSAHNIFVSRKLIELSGGNASKGTILPCGVDLDNILTVPRAEAMKAVGKTKPYVLFSSSFTNEVKNPSLAKEAIQIIPDTELVELKGYSRQEVNMLMNAASCLLMTSHREGSPQVIKEAIACGTPIVSVDVGDVKDVISGTDGCFIAERNPQDIAEKIKMALAFKGKTNGRKRIIKMGLSNELIAQKLIDIYHSILIQ